MKYNPNIHHRRSIRLEGYDYSKPGDYFITLECEDLEIRFGKIENKEMILNELGQIAYDQWIKIPERFPFTELGIFQVMPNHFHAIIHLNNQDKYPVKTINQKSTQETSSTIMDVSTNETSEELIENPNPDTVRVTLAVTPNDPITPGVSGTDMNGEELIENPNPDTIRVTLAVTPNDPITPGVSGTDMNGEELIENPNPDTIRVTLAVTPNDPTTPGVSGTDMTGEELLENSNPDTVRVTLAVTPNDPITPGVSGTDMNGEGAGVNPARTSTPSTIRKITLGDIVGAYKSLVFKECLNIYKSRGEGMGKLWDRNYYEIIIRDGRAYENISNYIKNNPANWKGDDYYKTK